MVMPYQGAIQGLNIDQLRQNMNFAGAASSNGLAGQIGGWNPMAFGGASGNATLGLPSVVDYSPQQPRGEIAPQSQQGTGSYTLWKPNLPEVDSPEIAAAKAQGQRQREERARLGLPDFVTQAGATAQPVGGMPARQQTAGNPYQATTPTGLSVPAAMQQTSTPADIQAMAMQKIGRNLDPAALNFLQKMSPAEAEAYLSNTGEAKKHAAQAPIRQQNSAFDAQKIAQELLGRDLPPAALQNLLGKTPAQMRAQISGSPEAGQYARGGTERIRAMGQELLGRDLDPGAIKFLQNMSPAEARDFLSKTPEAEKHSRRDEEPLPLENEEWMQQLGDLFLGRELAPEALRGMQDMPLQDVRNKIAQSPEATRKYVKDATRAQQAAPAIGLIGYEDELRSALDKSLGEIDTGATQAREDVLSGRERGLGFFEDQGALTGEYIEGGVQVFDPYTSSGAQANQLQAALSGALGPEAQAEAYANFQASPGQQFLRDQAEQALLRNASATGGLGGGAILDALQKQAIGYAAQDYQNYFNRLGGVSGQGLDAAGKISALLGQGAGLASTGGAQGLDFYGQTGRDLAQIAGSKYGARSDLYRGIGGDIGEKKYETGIRQQQRSDTKISALAELAMDEAANARDLQKYGIEGLGGLMKELGTTIGTDQQKLGEMLSQLGISETSALAKILLSRGGTGGTAAQGGYEDEVAMIIAAAIQASDIRLKNNIEKIGQTPGGHNLYLWEWTEEALPIVGDQSTVGVIAQEVQEKLPEAVTLGSDGFLRVDYRRIH